jgi:2-methylisocitrate lyase-like PEP mutase family enzyme
VTAADRLREALAGPDLLVVPVIGDPLAARLVQQSGLPAAIYAVRETLAGLPEYLALEGCYGAPGRD